MLFSVAYVVGLVVIVLSILPGNVQVDTFYLGIYIVALGNIIAISFKYVVNSAFST